MSSTTKEEENSDDENSRVISPNSQKTSTNDDYNIIAPLSTNAQSNQIPDGDKIILSIFIVNLPLDWSAEEVKKFVTSEVPEVRKIVMIKDRDRNFKGIVRVELATEEQRKEAEHAFHRKQIAGHSRMIRAFSTSEGEKTYLKRDKSNDEIIEETFHKKLKKDTTENVTKKLNAQDIKEAHKLTAEDILDNDPSGLYGLKPDFLKSLDITPPLTKWINVSNFRCDRTELKEVLELAGKVVMCKVVHNVKNKHATVMYSHPLEAVQAISMLHNQTYYGLPLYITMEYSTKGYGPLPKGLACVGPGLGMFGQPLTDIQTNFNKYLKEIKSELNEKIFRTPKEIEDDLEEFFRNKMNEENDITETSDEDIPEWVKNKMEKQNRSADSPEHDSYSPKPGISNLEANVGNTATDWSISTSNSTNYKYVPTQIPSTSNFVPNNVPSNSQVPPNFAQSTSLVRHNTFPVNTRPPNIGNYPIIPQNVPPMVPNPQVSIPGSWRHVRPQMGPVGPQMGCVRPPMVNALGPNNYMPPAQVSPADSAKAEFTTVEISNLPLSTTFPLLTEKMAQIGPVLSLQLTSPGCAVVQFCHSSCADMCYRIYNNANIMGNIVKVNYM